MSLNSNLDLSYIRPTCKPPENFNEDAKRVEVDGTFVSPEFKASLVDWTVYSIAEKIFNSHLQNSQEVLIFRKPLGYNLDNLAYMLEDSLYCSFIAGIAMRTIFRNGTSKAMYFFDCHVTPRLKQLVGDTFTIRLDEDVSKGMSIGSLIASWGKLSLPTIVRRPVDHRVLTVALYTFQQSGEMADFRLETSAGNSIPVHKLVLASASEFFKVMFINPDYIEAKSGMVQLKNMVGEPFSEAVLLKVVEFLYTKNITELPKNLAELKDLIELGVMLGCKDLAHLGTVGISEGKLVSEETFIEISRFASLHELEDLIAYCKLKLSCDTMFSNAIKEKLLTVLNALLQFRVNCLTDEEYKMKLTNLQKYCTAFGFTELATKIGKELAGQQSKDHGLAVVKDLANF